MEYPGLPRITPEHPRITRDDPGGLRWTRRTRITPEYLVGVQSGLAEYRSYSPLGRSATGSAKKDENILFKHPLLKVKNKALAKEKDRLRSRRFVPRWHGVLQRPENTLRTVGHNVQSLRAHNRDVALYEMFMGADILLLAETWLRPDEQGSLGDPGPRHGAGGAL